ncbi:unnamed protein product [Cyprideis torosa]|uniref:Dystroglycan 1 n=1 Tax=Cyprideis torosa TaxID=163714 RepID=A0A7R8WFI8_9CRUS|nr:unnamed protein product [Cyprideis torosa]CAG0895474.1 unnamed protein product [Cyprideis torosa]
MRRIGLPDDIMLIQAPPDTNPLKDGSSLIHGLGDGFKGKIKADRPLWIQWQIGCGGQISQKFSSLFASIQRDSSDGTLSEVIQHPLVGWHVTEFTPTLRILVRRQVMEGSGDGDISTPAHPSGGKAPVDQEEDDEDVYDDEVGTERSVVNFEEGSGGGAVPVDDAGKTTADYPATRPGSHTTGTVILEGTGPPVDEEEEKDLYTPVLFTPLITKGPYTTPQPGPARPTIVLSSYDFDQEDGDLMTPVFIPPDEEHSSSSVIETSPIVPSTSVEVESSPSIIEPSLTTSPVDEFTMLPPLPEVPTDTERPAPEEEEEPPRPPEPPPAPINNPPRVVTRFEKQAFIEGQPFTLRVPSDMFYDDEQGDTRSLRLSLKDKGYKELPWDSWIQLGDKRTEIRGLPLEANIGRWIYQLEAEDEYGASASDSLDIMIRQDPQSRIINHKFSLELAITQKGKHAFNEMTKLSQDLLLVQKLADLYGDPNWESIQVLNISQDPFSNVVTFSWRNFTLPSRTCPDRLLRELANILVDTNRGELSFATKESFRPEFNAKDARLEYAHACANYDPPIRPEPVTPPTKTNYAPIVNSAIDKITAHQGELLRYVVPEDTFYDTEDGDTRNMLLSLRVTDTDTPIPPNNWLQFDIKNQEFYGIPLKGDLGKREYTLMCADRDGEHARDALVVYVEHRPMFEHFNVEFTVEFEGDYTTFINSTRDKTRIVEKIADQFGDRTPEHVVVMDVRSGDRLSNGNTVVVAWRNKTIPKRPCPSKLIKELRTKVLDEHGMVSASLVDRFAPDFIVTHAEMIPLEDCLGQLTPTKELPPNRGGLPPDSTPSSSTGAEEFLATFLVPTVVVIALILAAAILACLLYRRNRKGSLTVRNSSYHKGVAPVIMAEELDDMKIEPTKEPVILRNDSASIPPPSYRNPSGHSTPAERTPLRDLSGPYHPPPPFAVDNRGSMGRPKPNSTFRKPPPYVPP